MPQSQIELTFRLRPIAERLNRCDNKVRTFRGDLMKYILILIMLIPQLTWAAGRTRSRKSTSSFSGSSFGGDSLFRIQGSYGVAIVDPVDLANYRKQFLWNNTTAADGILDRLPQTDFGIGVRIGPGPTQGSGSMRPTSNGTQVVIDLEGWRQLVGGCPSR